MPAGWCVTCSATCHPTPTPRCRLASAAPPLAAIPERACRRSRVEDEHLVKGKKEPVAICRLKRVAADYKDDEGIQAAMPKAPAKNGKRIACVGCGPASLTVANDLIPLGYDVVIYEKLDRTGGLMRTNIPAFRLPAEVLDEEIGYVTRLGVEVRLSSPVQSLRSLLDEGFDVGIRIGVLADSSLVARRLAGNRRVLCAAPAYLAARGAP